MSSCSALSKVPGKLLSTRMVRVSQLRLRSRILQGSRMLTTALGPQFNTKGGPQRPRLRSLVNVLFNQGYQSTRMSVRPVLSASQKPDLLEASQPPQNYPTIYSPPQTGLVSKLPSSWIPYAELIRLDKPTGTYYLFFPCLFSTLLAAPLATPISSPLEVLATSALFFTGALIMRGAGCTINDLWDRNLDPHVERTKFRPIARKAITPDKAVVFLGFQLLTGLGVLLQFPIQCLYYGIPSLLLVATYPLAKRVTNYPQLVLGFTFSWGAIMGFPALGIDILSNSTALASAAALYASCIAWTVNYDMVYAHMDIKDDVKAGIKSIALAHEHNTKAVLSGLTVAQIGLLTAAGFLTGSGPIFYATSCVGGGLTLAAMIWRVKLKNPADCWWWFKNGCWLTGGTIASGLLADYAFRRKEQIQDREPTLVTSSDHP